MVEIHDDHFRPDAPDAEWLTTVGRQGWVVLTKDRRIRYRGPEVAALMAAGVRAFVLTAGDLRGTEMAGTFLRALPAMTRFASQHPAPFIARVSKTGTVAMLLSTPAQ